jgi:hypothetical protein
MPLELLVEPYRFSTSKPIRFFPVLGLEAENAGLKGKDSGGL